MNIVIIGAGDVGLYIASLLSRQKYNVVLVDINGARLEEMTWQLDIAVKEGSGTDWKLLDSLLEMKPDLFLALTKQDEINLVACSIAKHLGYPRTIARVRDNLFLNRMRLDFGRLFNVDYFIGPELLVAYEIYKHLMSPGSLAFESFVHGAVQMRILQVPKEWKLSHRLLKDLQLPKGIIIGLIRRPNPAGEPYIIFPHGSDSLLPEDEVTFIGERQEISKIHEMLDLPSKQIESVVIIGGSLVGLNLARILQERGIKVRLIDKNYEHCLTLAEELPKCQIIHHEGMDLDFLMEEKVSQTDFLITCTNSDERNVLGALVAKEAGCKQVAVVLSNNRFVPLVNRLGIVHVVSPKVAAANQILSLATSKAVSSLVSLYENEAEILELTVSLHSKIIGIPLSDIGSKLPKDFLIAMIQNRGRITIAKGDSIICPGDTVIVICHPRYLQDLEKIF